MNIKHIIIVILIIIVFLLIMIGKGNDKIDKDVSKETEISTRETVPELKAETSNEDSEQQIIEKSNSAEAKSEEEAIQHISGKPLIAPGSIEKKDQHISGVPTLGQGAHISGQ